MRGTRGNGSCVGATVGLDGSVEHEDPGRQNLSWTGCGLRLFGIVFIGRNQNTYLDFSLAGHLALSWSQMTPAPSGMARICKK